jgi:hypothetical protein
VSVVSIKVTPPRGGRVPLGALMNDRARWAAIVNALRGADKYLVTGGRGVVHEITVHDTDYPRRALEAPASAAHHRGPTVCGSTYTDVER